MDLVIIGSGNGLPHFRRQAITWTKVDLLSTGLLGINFSEIWVGILPFSFRKIQLDISSAKMVAILFRWRWVKMIYEDIEMMQVCPTILFYPCLHRNDSWWIPGNEGPIVVPAAIFHLHSWIVWWLIKSLWWLLNMFFMSLQCFLFAENTLNDLWYEKTYIYRLSQPTALIGLYIFLNQPFFRYERYIVCPKTRACQRRDHNFKWEWNVQRPYRNSPQNVSALQWWTFLRYGHGMDSCVWTGLD